MLPTFGESTFVALYGIVFCMIIKKAKHERIKNPPYRDGLYRTHPWATPAQYLRQVRILFVTVVHGYVLWELSRCASHFQYQIFRCNILKIPEPCDKEDGSWFKSAKKECDIELQNTLDWNRRMADAIEWYRFVKLVELLLNVPMHLLTTYYGIDKSNYIMDTLHHIGMYLVSSIALRDAPGGSACIWIMISCAWNTFFHANAFLAYFHIYSDDEDFMRKYPYELMKNLAKASKILHFFLTMWDSAVVMLSQGCQFPAIGAAIIFVLTGVSAGHVLFAK